MAHESFKIKRMFPNNSHLDYPHRALLRRQSCFSLLLPVSPASRSSPRPLPQGSRLWKIACEVGALRRISAECSRGQCGHAEEGSLASRNALAIFAWKCLPWKLNYIWDFWFPLPQPLRGRFRKVTVVTVAIGRLSAFQLCTRRLCSLLQRPGLQGPCARRGGRSARGGTLFP